MEALASDYKTDKDFLNKRIDGTCVWCFQDERFIDWRDCDSSSLLWISAGPGCGKSVLSRALIDEGRVSKNAITTTVCSWFFRDGQQYRTHNANALSAILHQLFYVPTLATHGPQSFQNYGSKLSEFFAEL